MRSYVHECERVCVCVCVFARMHVCVLSACVSVYMFVHSCLQNRIIMNQKASACEECKNDYASVLQQFNANQQEHYYTLMPQVFQVGRQERWYMYHTTHLYPQDVCSFLGDCNVYVIQVGKISCVFGYEIHVFQVGKYVVCLGMKYVSFKWVNRLCV